MALTRAQFEKELRPGVKTWVASTYNRYKNQWNQIFKEETSDLNYEEVVKLVGFGYASEKAEGSTITNDEGAGEAWASRYEHKVYATGFTITEEAVEDNRYMKLARVYSQAMATSLAQTKEVNGANIINLGFSANPQFVCGDGQPLFGAHTTKGGFVNTNYAVVGTDLNEATLENALIQISQFVDERGLKINVDGSKLLIPKNLQFVAKRLMGSDYQPGSNNNDINATKALGMLSGGVVVNNFLTDTNAWFILTDLTNGAKHYKRRAMKVQDDADFDTGNFKFKATERYSFGYDDPLFIWGSQGGS